MFTSLSTVIHHSKGGQPCGLSAFSRRFLIIVSYREDGACWNIIKPNITFTAASTAFTVNRCSSRTGETPALPVICFQRLLIIPFKRGGTAILVPSNTVCFTTCRGRWFHDGDIIFTQGRLDCHDPAPKNRHLQGIVKAERYDDKWNCSGVPDWISEDK